VFVWLFHRVSGLLLVILLPLQLATGLLQGDTTHVQLARLMADLHRHGFLNCLVAFLAIFHGVYGVRTLLLDAGMRHEKLLFWLCTLVGGLLFAGFVWIWMMRGAA